MFQNDAVTYVNEISGATTDIFTDSGDYTVTLVSIVVSDDTNEVELKCGDDLIAKVYATPFNNIPFSLVSVPMNYQCADDILQISKTGAGNATSIVTYVPYLTGNYSTTTQFGYNPDGDISTSTDVQIFGSISAGELIISSILLMMLLFKGMELIARGLSGIQLKRKFIKYQGGDVPVDSQ